MNRRGLLLVLTVACGAAAVPRIVAIGGAAACGVLFAVEMGRYFFREWRWRRTVAEQAPAVPDPPDCGAVAEPIPGFTWSCSQAQGHEGPHEGYELRWPVGR